MYTVKLETQWWVHLVQDEAHKASILAGWREASAWYGVQMSHQTDLCLAYQVLRITSMGIWCLIEWALAASLTEHLFPFFFLTEFTGSFASIISRFFLHAWYKHKRTRNLSILLKKCVRIMNLRVKRAMILVRQQAKTQTSPSPVAESSSCFGPPCAQVKIELYKSSENNQPIR